MATVDRRSSAPHDTAPSAAQLEGMPADTCNGGAYARWRGAGFGAVTIARRVGVPMKSALAYSANGGGMRPTKLLFLTTMLTLTLLGGTNAVAQSDRIEWVDQFGTVGFDAVDGVAAGADSVYATGRVGFGSLPGQVSDGGVDSFLKKYDASGNVIWTRQFGTPGFDGFTEAVVDGAAVFVFGLTTGTVPGQVSAGGPDIFLQVFDDAGQPITTSQFGTSGVDFVLSATAHDSHLYVFGFTSGEFDGQASQGGSDFFVAKMSEMGDLLWVDQFGTPEDDPTFFTLGGIAVDDDGIYIGSSVATPLAGSEGLESADGFLRSYDHAGQEQWTRAIGTGCTDLVTSLALHGSDLVVTGVTFGDLADPWSTRCTLPPLNQRDRNRFPRTFVQLRSAGDGAEIWTRQYEGNGINQGEFSLGIKVASGPEAIYVASEALRTPATQPPDPSCPTGQGGFSEDVHVRAYDLNGDELWTQIIGTRATDAPSGLAVNATGAYVGGVTSCSLAGQPPAGSGEAFFLKVRTDPE